MFKQCTTCEVQKGLCFLVYNIFPSCFIFFLEKKEHFSKYKFLNTIKLKLTFRKITQIFFQINIKEQVKSDLQNLN